MSMILAAKAWQIQLKNPIQKMILVKLADNANDKGECWPSYKHIADHCGVSRRTVIRHIDALEQMGLVKKTHRRNEKGNRSNLFLVCLDGAKETKNLVTQCHHPSDKETPPLVTDDHHPSDTGSPTLVTQCHPEPVIKNQSMNHKKTNKKENQNLDGANAPGVCFSDDENSEPENHNNSHLDDIPTQVLDRGAISTYCRSQGINATPSHALQKVIDMGATMQHFVDAVAIAKEKGNASWPYVLGIAKNLAIEDQKPVAAPEPRASNSNQRFSPSDFFRRQNERLAQARQAQEVDVTHDSDIIDIEMRLMQ